MRGRSQRFVRRLSRILRRALRHPRYALAVVLGLVSRPRLVWNAVRGGWRQALWLECARQHPGAAELVSRYEAGFYGQVCLFDEYEVGRLGLPAEPVVLDVGANVGFFTWRVQRLRPRARVLAFEPQSDNFRRLERLLELGGRRAEAIRAAVGASAGSATLYLRNSVTHSLDRDWHQDLDSGAGSEQVPVTTLDAECDRRGIPTVDLLKIDTEGAELEVLRGARDTLSRARAVVLEYHSDTLGDACQELLEAQGFHCRRKSFWGLDLEGAPEGLLLCTRGAPASRAQPAAATSA